MGDLFFIQFMCQQVMAVHVKLKPERRPCRDAEIAEAEFPVDKIEIVMKALALVKLQESLSGCFIMPWLVSITALHGRENVNQAFCFPGFSDDLLDAVIFAECMEFSDKLNFNPILLSNLFCILTNLLRKGLRETGIIKNTDTVELHICGHCISMAPVRDISLDDHAVITGNDAVNFIDVFIRK